MGNLQRWLCLCDNVQLSRNSLPYTQLPKEVPTHRLLTEGRMQPFKEGPGMCKYIHKRPAVSCSSGCYIWRKTALLWGNYLSGNDSVLNYPWLQKTHGSECEFTEVMWHMEFNPFSVCTVDSLEPVIFLCPTSIKVDIITNWLHFFICCTIHSLLFLLRLTIMGFITHDRNDQEKRCVDAPVRTDLVYKGNHVSPRCPIAIHGK